MRSEILRRSFWQCWRKLSGNNNKPDHALLLTNLALLYREAGQNFTKSETLLRQVIVLETDALPPLTMHV